MSEPGIVMLNESGAPTCPHQLFILPNGLSRMYLSDLKKATHKNSHFKISDNFNVESVAFVATALDDYEKIIKLLKISSDVKLKVVSTKWLVDSNKSNTASVLDYRSYLIKNPNEAGKDSEANDKEVDDSVFQLDDYECQRITKLEHFNKEFTDALEILEEYADYRNSECDSLRALAFRRGICALRSLPKRLTNVKQLRNVKNVGEHTRSVLQDILKYGYSKEADAILEQEYYQTAFNSIYGCGPVVSNRLYELGYRSIQDLRKEEHYKLNKILDHDFDRFKYGLTYHEDLNTSIDHDEALNIFEIIKKIILDIDKNFMLDIVGGFRRGKQKGHDLDILVTHPVSGEEKGVLTRVLEILQTKGHLISSRHDKAAECDWAKPVSKNILDHFERFIGILRFPRAKLSEEPSAKRAKLANYDGFDTKDEDLLSEMLSCLNATKFERDWLARRVDIIICPVEQHAFALLGWTGSRQFNRSIRLYSEKEFNYRLTSHGIYDHLNGVKIGANSEKQIFDILKLKYLEPHERNC